MLIISFLQWSKRAVKRVICSQQSCASLWLPPPPSPLLTAFAALGNDDSQIVGQCRSCLTGQPASIFLSATATDPEE